MAYHGVSVAVARARKRQAKKRNIKKAAWRGSANKSSGIGIENIGEAKSANNQWRIDESNKAAWQRSVAGINDGGGIGIGRNENRNNQKMTWRQHRVAPLRTSLRLLCVPRACISIIVWRRRRGGISNARISGVSVASSAAKSAPAKIVGMAAAWRRHQWP